MVANASSAEVRYGPEGGSRSRRPPFRWLRRLVPHWTWKRWLLVTVVTLVLIQVLVPLVTLNGARSRILQALQAGLGRQVEAGDVHLHLLPWPSLELDQVQLADDAAFGSEDMVFADEATATVRFWPLVRGRLVIARVHLEGASINLVRNGAGAWNIAALLQRVSRPHPGTAGSPILPAQSFPYLEWSDSRINIKLDQTKTRFYLDQVQGSLAHDSEGWRFQASFEPERTDLNLSDTGNVTVDGRWPDGGGPFRQRPFEMELRLRNSYLAGSSALLAGHDAGVHGVLDADMHVEGPGLAPGSEPAGFHLTGNFEAHSVRRWDLLPPPATVSGSFSGLYYPAQDRLEIIGLGDPGWQHVQLQGEVANVFTSPDLRLHLQLRAFDAAHLLPLFTAVKANLPADLSAQGVVSGNAQLALTGLRTHPSASGNLQITLRDFTLGSGQESLRLPEATLAWSSRASHPQLQLLPAAARLQPAGTAPPAALQVAASADREGFGFSIRSPAFTSSDAAAITRLLGLASPWPQGLTGVALLQLRLAGPWAGSAPVGWQGTARIAGARFLPLAERGLRLQSVEVDYADPKPVRVAFTAGLEDASLPARPASRQPTRRLARPGRARGADSGTTASSVRGTIWLPSAGSGGAGPGVNAPVQFELQAAHVRDGQIWNLLRPRQTSLWQRVLRPLTFAHAAQPAWLDGIAARGSVHVTDLDWHGFHTTVQMQLHNGAQGWTASALQLRLAGGRFEGSGSLAAGNYHLDGSVPGKDRLELMQLLATTPYQGLLSGALAGDVHLDRPLGSTSLGAVAASGHFEIRDGTLATAQGRQPFRRFAGDYRLSQGIVTLTHVVWDARGGDWAGEGTAALLPGGRGFRLTLNHATSSTRKAAHLVWSGPVVIDRPGLQSTKKRSR